MAYLPDIVPGPEPMIDDAPFWQHCQERKLCFQRCRQCGHVRNPPAVICLRCRSFDSEWVDATPDAQLFSYTVVNYASLDGMETALPYNVAIVAFPSLGGVRLVSNVIDVPPDQLAIGMKLHLVWETCGNGRLVPRFAAGEEKA